MGEGGPQRRGSNDGWQGTDTGRARERARETEISLRPSGQTRALRVDFQSVSRERAKLNPTNDFCSTPSPFSRGLDMFVLSFTSVLQHTWRKLSRSLFLKGSSLGKPNGHISYLCLFLMGSFLRTGPDSKGAASYALERERERERERENIPAQQSLEPGGPHRPLCPGQRERQKRRELNYM